MAHVEALSGAVIAMAVGSLTIGCAAVGPNYARPQMPNPAQYRFVEGTAQAQSLADSPWWQVFGVSLALAIPTAFLSWHTIESRCRWRARPSVQTTPATAGAAAGG